MEVRGRALVNNTNTRLGLYPAMQEHFPNHSLFHLAYRLDTLQVQLLSADLPFVNGGQDSPLATLDEVRRHLSAYLDNYVPEQGM